MTVHQARVLALASVLIGISALVPNTPLQAQQPLDEVRALAEQGDPEAQINLGVMYTLGTEVPQDNAEAARWYRLAAEQGHADAQFQLGATYLEGQGVRPDHAEAVVWFRRAALQGLAVAQFALGVMFANGEGVLQDAAEAVR